MLIGLNGENESECHWATNHACHRYNSQIFVVDLPLLFEDAFENEGETENGYESRDHTNTELQKQESEGDHFC